MSGSFVFVARQAGTGYAFVPVVRELQDRDAAVSVIAYPEAGGAFEEYGIRFQPTSSFDPSLVPERSFNTLITGTSLEVLDDGRWWDWARQGGARTIGFVDQWVNYWQRFTSSPDDGRRWDVVPDVIGVVDDLARTRMVEAGCDPNLLATVGSPLVDLLCEPHGPSIAATRRSMGIGESDVLVLVVGESSGEAEQDLMAFIVAALAQPTDRRVVLVYRPHPRTRDLPPLPATAHIPVVRSSADRTTLTHATDIGVGRRSVMLWELSLLDTPAISVVPEGQEPWDVARHEGVGTVSQVADLRSIIDSATANRWTTRQPGTLPTGAATTHFLSALGVSPEARTR